MANCIKRVCSPKAWKKELMSILFWRTAFMELLATVLLMTLVMLMLITNDEHVYKPNPLHIGIAAGFLVFIIIEGYEGAHLNPAVSVTFLVSGRMSFFKTIVFVIVQIISGCIVAGIGPRLSPVERRADYHPILPAVSDGKAVIIEALLTFNLCFVALSLTDPRRKPAVPLAGFPIGFCIAIGAFVAGTHTAGLMNPIISLIAAIITGNFSKHWIYWIGPCLGGVVAGLLYNLLFFIKSRYSPKSTNPDGTDVKKEELSELLTELLNNGALKSHSSTKDIEAHQ